MTQEQYLNAFQEACKRTRSRLQNDFNGFLLNGTMGLAGETTEVLEPVFRAGYAFDTVDRQNILFELGDVLWYAADLCTTLGKELGKVAPINLDVSAEPWVGRTPDALTFALRMVVASGKALEGAKKLVFHGKAQDPVVFTEAISRVVFCAAMLASTFEARLVYVLQTNIDKLAQRYPDGFKVAK